MGLSFEVNMSTPYYNSKGVHRTRLPPDNTKTKACQLWENIKNRCEYLPKMDEKRFGKYQGADACEEWKDFQNFAQWFEDVQNSGYYEKGWQLDKDLLVKGNKIYSPETCVFLPEEVNKALNTKSRTRGELPLGMCYGGTRANRKSHIQVYFNCKYPEFTAKIYLPNSHENIQFGFMFYKNAREKYIRFLAEKYKNELDPRAYNALKNYEVMFDD